MDSCDVYIKADQISSSVITLNWKESPDTELYLVEWPDIGGTWTGFQIEQPPIQRGGLSPDIEYNLRIRTKKRSSGIWSKPGKEFFFRTSCVLPKTVLTNSIQAEAGPHSISLSWKSEKEIELNSKVTRYRIRACEPLPNPIQLLTVADREENNPDSTCNTNLSALIYDEFTVSQQASLLDLRSGTTYIITISQLNRSGLWGPASLPIAIKTVMSLPEIIAAGDVELDCVDSISVSFHWREPRNNGSLIEKYDIRYSSVNGVHIISHTGTTKYVIDNLLSATCYSLSLRSTNGVGISNWSPEFSFKTATPTMVSDIKLENRTTDSLHLLFTKKPSLRCKVISFLLCYKYGMLSDFVLLNEFFVLDKDQCCEDEIDYRHIHQHLPPNEEVSYVIKCRSEQDGEIVCGPASDVVSFKVLPGRPSPPMPPSFHDGLLNWETPPNRGSPITRFDVRVRTPLSDVLSNEIISPDVTTTPIKISGGEGDCFFVMISASNILGTSSWSPPLELRVIGGGSLTVAA